MIVGLRIWKLGGRAVVEARALNVNASAIAAAMQRIPSLMQRVYAQPNRRSTPAVPSRPCCLTRFRPLQTGDRRHSSFGVRRPDRKAGLPPLFVAPTCRGALQECRSDKGSGALQGISREWNAMHR